MNIMDQQDHTKDLRLKNRWYFIDLSASVELFLILRGIIAGCVTISISASNFLPWTALLNGFLGGFFYIVANKITYRMQIDDATHIATTHGITSFYSLFSICLFHKDEGFFFNDVYLRSQNLLTVMTEDQIEIARQRIIVILGTNSLGALVVMFTVGIISFLLFTFIFRVFF